MGVSATSRLSSKWRSTLLGADVLGPLALDEIRRFPQPAGRLGDVLWAGGYPRIYDQHLPAHEWLGNYVATYVERDVRQLLRIADLVTFQTFLRLCAGRTGHLLNVSGLGADCGITQPTAQSWLSVLETSYVVFRLPALRTNVRKRLVKAPKLYFHDTGLLCYLPGIRTPEQLESHPLRGAVFECWVVSEILKHHLHAARPRRCTSIATARDMKSICWSTGR